jgi:uncharacterized protein
VLLALIGGILIGLSASLAWSGARQIAGISGIVGRFVSAPLGGGFAASFLGGLVLTSALLGRVAGVWQSQSAGARPLLWLAVAGLLVGYGTRLGSGCTSGHGVCGLSRLSARSLVATLTFMLTAGLVVLITRHVFAGVSP